MLFDFHDTIIIHLLTLEGQSVLQLLIRKRKILLLSFQAACAAARSLMDACTKAE